MCVCSKETVVRERDLFYVSKEIDVRGRNVFIDRRKPMLENVIAYFSKETDVRERDCFIAQKN